MDRASLEKIVKLDPEFGMVEPSNHRNHFRPGKVMKVPWAQPAGESTLSDPWSTPAKFNGESVYQKVKRFIVVRPFKGHCVALAITTHGGQGTTKPGVNPDDHAAIVAVGDEVKLLPGEHLKRGPIEVIIENKKHAMSPASRIDFSRLYTIEYSCKVLGIGRIAHSQIPRLIEYMQQTMWKTQDLDYSDHGALYDETTSVQTDVGGNLASVEDAKLPTQKDISPAVSQPSFQAGDRVLLPHTKGSGTRAKFKPLLVKESRMVPTGMRWEYKLQSGDQEAEYGGGAFFPEERLLPS